MSHRALIRRRPWWAADGASAADVFLDSLGNPNTVRNYGIGVGKTAARLGEGRPLASVADDEIGEALQLLWGHPRR